MTQVAYISDYKWVILWAADVRCLLQPLGYFQFLLRDALVHSAVLRLHVVRPSVCSSVCDVGGSGSHRLEILETNCTDTFALVAQRPSTYSRENMGEFGED